LNPDTFLQRPAGDLVILAVDDQRFQRRVLATQLQGLGATTVLEAGDGAEALGIIDANPGRIALIITDIDMPSMDGLALLRRIGERLPTVPIVVLSALDAQLLRSVEAMCHAFRVNLLAILSKPASEEALEAAVEHARLSHSGIRPGPTVALDDAALSLALQGNQLEPWFQPKARLIDGVPCGAEVLMRWRHPEHGILTPAAFMQSLENSPLLRPVTLTLAARVAKFIAIVRNRIEPFSLSVNISPKLLDDPEFAAALANSIIELGVAPEHITIEVTESAVASCEGTAIENLTRLRMRGFGLSIDDFGTGYSSLAQLTQAPFTELKIDQRFVRALGHDPRSEDLVRSTLDLARRLGLYTVAEGVETEAQRQLLIEFGCDAAQGYMFAKPMPVFQWLSWMEAVSPASS
jgi:EAL domain-containing protein (putative c-di-GMP-specific phosphodiesterase class I)/ActR/RegA family two-component response regulator